jgi:hypothetical protein
MMVISNSAKQFDRLIQEEYNKLIEKRKKLYLSVYEKYSKTNKNNPLVCRFYELIQTDIQSIELLSLVYRLKVLD